MDAKALVTLPVLDADAAITLALQLEQATVDEKGKPRKLPESVKAALHDVEETREALQKVVGTAPAPEAEVAAVDRCIDAVLRALYYLFKAWEILIDILPEGEEAEALRTRIFGEEGLGLINLPSNVEWGVVDTKLKLIDNEKLGPRIDALGAGKMLAYLREIHVQYGEVTGQKAQRPEGSPEVRGKLDALSEALRHYIAAVIGSVVRKKPDTKELSDALLQPLVNWDRSKPKRKAKAGATKKASETKSPGEAKPGAPTSSEPKSG